MPAAEPAAAARRADTGAVDESGSGGRLVGWLLLAGIPVAMFALFFFYPVGSLIGRGLAPAGTVDGQGVIDVLGKPRVQRIALFTVWQAAASAAIAVALGLPGAYLLYRCRFRGRTAVRALVTVPFVLPTIVVALAFRTLFAADGPLGGWGWDGTVYAILAAHVFLNYAVVVRTVGASWAHLDNRPAEAARSLGAGPVRVFLTITVPALLPAIAAAFVLVFLFCATSFGIMLILGGAQYGTLETEIYRQTAQIGDLRAAAVLSILQLVLVVAVLLVAAAVRRRGEATLRLRAAVDLARPLRRADLPAVLITAAVGGGIDRADGGAGDPIAADTSRSRAGQLPGIVRGRGEQCAGDAGDPGARLLAAHRAGSRGAVGTDRCAAVGGAGPPAAAAGRPPGGRHPGRPGDAAARGQRRHGRFRVPDRAGRSRLWTFARHRC